MTDLEALEMLVGEWTAEAVDPGSGEPTRGAMTVEWLEGGGYLVQRTTMENPIFPRSLSMFGPDEACLEALGTGADVGTRLRRWLRGGRRRRVAARDRPRAIRRQGDALVAGRPVFGHGDRKRAADEFPSRENAMRTSVPRSDSDVTRSPSVSLQISPSPRPPPP